MSEERTAPAVDFSTFIISLGTSVMYHLGAIPDPEHPERKPQVNLAMAQQSIDILAMLRDKTEGNRTPEESALIDKWLYDLRMRFVEAMKSVG